MILMRAVFGLSPNLHGMCTYNASLDTSPATGPSLFSSVAGAGYASCGSVRHGAGPSLGIPRVLFVAAAITLIVSAGVSLWIM